jgi:hypothetical protein
MDNGNILRVFFELLRISVGQNVLPNVHVLNIVVIFLLFLTLLVTDWPLTAGG